jgi:hypothetical protein
MGQGLFGTIDGAVSDIMGSPGWEERLAREYAGRPYGGTRNAQSDFRNGKGDSTLATHFDEHGEGFPSAEAYRDAARGFLEKPPTPTTQTFVTDVGTYVKYDTATNECGMMIASQSLCV